MTSLYRRPLPGGQIAFASPEGRAVFREALALGTLEGFFPLIEQFHTQADPSFCGLGSLVMALNAFGIDPGRLWRGPWRWFSEELLDCCTPLDTVRKTGLSIEEVACLARCNGADARVERPDGSGPERLRSAVVAAARGGDVALLASYSRAGLGQTGGGHFSPIGGYHAARDLVLVLDVARFKYPPHWVPLGDLHAAMIDADPVTGRSRGWIELRRRGAPSSLAYFVTCAQGMGIGAALDELVGHTRARLRADAPRTRADVLRSVAASADAGRLLACFALRKPETAEHERMLAVLRSALTQSAMHQALAHALDGEQRTELLAAWLLAAPDELFADLDPQLTRELQELVALETLSAELVDEVSHVRRQVEFLLQYARGAG